MHKVDLFLELMKHQDEFLASDIQHLLEIKVIPEELQMGRSNEIRAIKMLRERTKCRLLVAKVLVDKALEDFRMNDCPVVDIGPDIGSSEPVMIKTKSNWYLTQCPTCGMDVQCRSTNLDRVAATGDETLAGKEYMHKKGV
jgi:hypothetical protein